MNRNKGKNNQWSPAVFFNIFPKPIIKQEPLTKQQSFHQTTQSINQQSNKKSPSTKKRKSKKPYEENSDSLYQPSQCFSDSQIADQKPHKKIKLENSTLKIEKNQSVPKNNYKKRLRVRDFEVISREQYQKAKNKLKKQNQVKILAFNVDQSCEIYI